MKRKYCPYLASLLHDEVLAMASMGCTALNNFVELVSHWSLQKLAS